MVRNNLDEIDQYFSALVKNERIQLVQLVDPEGKVLLSSDRKFMGSEVSGHFPAALLMQTSVSILPGEDKVRRMVVFILGLNKRIGTVLLAYFAPHWRRQREGKRIRPRRKRAAIGREHHETANSTMSEKIDLTDFLVFVLRGIYPPQLNSDHEFHCPPLAGRIMITSMRPH